MSRTMVSFGAALCAAVLLLADPGPCHGAKPTPAEARIEEALDSPTQIEFIETPLNEVVDDLKDRHQIEIQIDTRALEDVGITTDTPISKDIKGLSLRSTLRLLLRDLDLTFLPGDEVLQITTPEEAENQLTVTVYRVADLIACGDCGGQRLADAERLVEVLIESVDPDTWDEVGGPGSIVPVSFGNVGALVIAQTYDVHRKIAALLADLRVVAGCKPQANGPAATRRCSCRAAAAPLPAHPSPQLGGTAHPTQSGFMRGGMGGMGGTSGMGMGGMRGGMRGGMGFGGGGSSSK